MPDVYGNIPQTPQPQEGYTKITDPNISLKSSTPIQPQVDELDLAFKKAMSSAYDSAILNGKSDKFNNPVISTPLKNTLRYLDPNMGFDVLDSDLEQKYGEEQGILGRVFNRALKTGATALVSFAETMDSTYRFMLGQDSVDAPEITEANEWLHNLDAEYLPNYETYYKRDNPILSYFNPLHFTTWLDNMGNVTQNLGYTVGAIGASLIIDVPLSLVGAAAGQWALLPKQASKIYSAIGKMSRVLTSTAENYNEYKNLINSGDDVIRALTKADDIKKGFNTGRFLTSTAISAYGESIAEGNNLLIDLTKSLEAEYSDEFGNFKGTEEDRKRIMETAKSAAKDAIAPNFAFLFVSNMFGLGSILRPGAAAMRATEKSLAQEASLKLSGTNINAFDVITAPKASGFKGLVKKGGLFGAAMVDNVREGLEEGYQFAVSQTLKDYYTRKFDPRANKEVNTFEDSLLRGAGDVFGTTEGQENVTLGFLGGSMQRGIKSLVNKARGISPLRGEALAQQIKSNLEQTGVTSLFDVNRNQAVTAANLTYEMQEAAKTGDIFSYKTLQHQQLFNFISSAVKSNKFDLRVEQLQSLKGLSKENFETLFNLDFNEMNKKTVDEYVDSIIAKATEIKGDVEKVGRVFNNPYLRGKNPKEWFIFDSYKDELALSLSEQRDFLRRSKSVRNNILNTLPTGSLNEVIALSSEDGVKETIEKFKAQIADLKNSENLAQGNKELIKGYREQREFLEEKTKDLEESLNNFDSYNYVKTANDLFNYYANANQPIGDISIDQMATSEVLNNAADLVNLEENTDRVKRYYQTLSRKEGYEKFAGDLARRIDGFVDRVQVGADGRFTIAEDKPEAAPAQPGEAKDKDYVEKELGIKDLKEGEEKIEQEDKEFIAKVVDPENGEEAKNIREGKTPITKEVKERAKELLKTEFAEDEIVAPKGKVAVGDKAKAREERIQADMKAKGINPSTAEDTDINDILEEEAKAKAPVVEEATPQGQEPVTGIQKFWQKFAFNPIKLWNRVFSKNFKDIAYNNNLRGVIFNNLPESVIGNLRIEISESTQGKKVDEFTKHPEFTDIYRSGYEIEVRMYHGDTPVGLLQPPTSLAFKSENRYETLDKLQNSTEYAKVTGNSPETFEQFKREYSQYKDAYNKLVSRYNGQVVSVSNKELRGLFKPVISYGNVDLSRRAATSTKIKDLQYRGKGDAVLSFPMLYNEDTETYERETSPMVLNAGELTDEQFTEVSEFISDNLGQIQAQDARYIYIMRLPDGSFDKRSIIVARPVDEANPNLEGFLLDIKATLENKDGKTISHRNTELGNSVYIAHDKKIRKTGIRFSVNKEGNLILNIYNKQLGVRKKLTISKEEVLSAKDFDSFLQLANGRIIAAERGERNLSRLGIELTPQSFKQSIPNDENVTIEDLENKLALSVKPHVFENFAITLLPKTGVALEEPIQEFKPPVEEVKVTPAGEEVIQTEKHLAVIDAIGTEKYLGNEELTEEDKVKQQEALDKIDVKDIERRRQEELSLVGNIEKDGNAFIGAQTLRITSKTDKGEYVTKEINGVTVDGKQIYFVGNDMGSSFKEVREDINAKYDAELAALEKTEVPVKELVVEVVEEKAVIKEVPVIEDVVLTEEQEEIKEQVEEIIEKDKWLSVIPEGSNDFVTRVKEIQQAYKEGRYDEALREGNLSEEDVKAIFTSAKLHPSLVENVLFRVNNEGAQYSVDNLLTMPKNLVHGRVMEYFLETGKFQEAVEKDMIDLLQAKILLNNHNAFTDKTRAVKEKLFTLISEKETAQKEAAKQLAKQAQVEAKKQEKIIEKAVEQGVIEAPVEDVQRTPVEEPATEPVVEDTGFKVGDEVLFKDQKGKVAEIDADGDMKIVDDEDNFIGFSQKGKNLEKYVVPTKNFVEIGTAFQEDPTGFRTNIKGIFIEQVSMKLPKSEHDRLVAQRDGLVSVVQRMKLFFPNLVAEIGFFEGSWKGRFKDGKVQINVTEASIDTPIHEFLHPFVFSIRKDNETLYRNLLDDLKNNAPHYFQEINKDPNYKDLPAEDKLDEALVRYLSDEMVTVFRTQDETVTNEDGSTTVLKAGTIDEVKLEEKSQGFVQFVYDWFLKIWGFIFGQRKNVGVDRFVKNLNERYAKTKYRFSSTYDEAGWVSRIMGTPGGPILQFNEKYYTSKSTPEYLLGGVKEKITQKAYANLRKHIDEQIQRSLAGRKLGEYTEMIKITYDPNTQAFKAYRPGKADASKKFTSSLEELEKNGVPKEIANELRARVKEAEGAKVMIETEVIKTLVKAQEAFKMTGKENKTILPSEIPGTFTLKNISDFILGQEMIAIDLSSQQAALDKMEAYQHGTQRDAADILKRIAKKLEVFSDTGDRRIVQSQLLKPQANAIRRILREYDGVEAVAQYVRQGIGGLELAAKMIRYIQEDLKGDNLTEKDINELNRDLVEVRTLMSFYDDVGNLMNYYHEEFDEQEMEGFERVMLRAKLRQDLIGSIANQLTVEWMYPFLEEAQANLPEDKRLSKEDFARKLRFADKDASSMTYWLGATINSRDPINAILAVIVKDKLNANHNEESERLNDIRVTFDNFIKRSGVANSVKALEEYYQKNYLRKAKVWEVVGYDKEKEEKKYAYVERWAFHEENYWDLFHDDLRIYTESLGEPHTEEEWDKFNANRNAWINANHPSVNNKYKNPAFENIYRDEYFKLLYDTYKSGNEKYGERKLNFGIVPQAYRVDGIVKNVKDAAKKAPQYFKDLAGENGVSKVEKVVTDLGSTLFDSDGYMKAQDMNLDGSYYRGIKSPFTHLIDQEHLDFRLNESVFGFYTSANTFSSLREVQANVENLKLLIEGNHKLGVEARKVSKVDKTGSLIFDRFWKRPQVKELEASKLNKQLTGFINDVFYGEEEIDSNLNLGAVNINMNKLGRNLGFATALYNMAGNVFAGISNVTIGNVQSLGEAIGGRYYKPKNWLHAQKTYLTNTHEFMADVSRPVKSKITQLGILYDAIQGEFRDKYGKNITGNVAKRYATGDTFFLINHVAEHQIQLQGMLALMDATKVKLKDGSSVTLFDAYKKNSKGFYKLREDAIWTDKDNLTFMKTLHGISKDLNGNYAAFDKGVLQRLWYGKLILQYRKYMYPAWRARFASERIDYERGDVQEGYYRTFMKSFVRDLKNYKFNVVGLMANQWKKNGYTEQEAYAHRKTMFDLSIMVATFVLAATLAGMEGDDDDDNKWAQNALMLSALRLRSDISQYSFTAPQEFIKQSMNPSASLNTLKNWGDFLVQLTNPDEVYKRKDGGHEKGDSKLGAKFEKIVPLYRQWLRLQRPEDQVQYYTLINKDVDSDNKIK